MRVSRLSCVSLLGMLSVGCSGVGIKQPTASFNRMSLGEVTPQGFTMNFDVTFENVLAAESALAKGDLNLPYTLEGGLDVGGPKLLGQGARVPLKYEGVL